MSNEPDRQDLEDRVEQLESTIAKMLPSRRDALKLGGAALVGGAAMSGSASAGTQQAGTIGTANDPVDVESEDINNADTVTTDTLNAQDIDAASVSTDKVDFTGMTTGATSLLSKGQSGTNRIFVELAQFTDGVSTTQTEIYEPDTVGEFPFCNRVVVAGANGGVRFIDTLTYLSAGNVNVISSNGRENPPSRSYFVGGGFNLSLTMGSGSFEVAAVGTGINLLS